MIQSLVAASLAVIAVVTGVRNMPRQDKCFKAKNDFEKAVKKSDSEGEKKAKKLINEFC